MSRPSNTSRSRLGLLSLAVLAASFAGTTWLLGVWSGNDTPSATLPGLARPTPQAPDPAPPPVAARPPGQSAGPEAPAPDADARTTAALAADLAEEAARAEVSGAVESADESLAVRVDLYLDALARALEATGDAAMLAYRSVWAEHFLRIDAVQAELAAASPAGRRSMLANVRRRMGFDEEQIERMAALDARRDARWATGLDYMAERRRLEATFEGEALQAELRHLRERTFGATAETIAREEARGFFRFERERVYGRN